MNEEMTEDVVVPNIPSYEKKVVTRTIKIQHIVRVREGEPAETVMKNLRNVPTAATLSMVLTMSPVEGMTEIVFSEPVSIYKDEIEE